MEYVEPTQTEATAAARTFKSLVIRVLEWVGKVMNYIAIGIVSFLAFPICYDVIARALGHPSIWVFEITLYSLGASAFLANAAALKDGAHFRITFLSTLFPRLKKPLDHLALLTTLIFGVVLMLSGGMFAWQSFVDSVLSVSLLSLPLYIPQSELALGGLALAVQALAMLLKGGYPDLLENGGHYE